MKQNSQSIRLGFPGQVGKQLRCVFHYGAHSDRPNSWFLLLTTAQSDPPRPTEAPCLCLLGSPTLDDNCCAGPGWGSD